MSSGASKAFALLNRILPSTSASEASQDVRATDETGDEVELCTSPTAERISASPQVMPTTPSRPSLPRMPSDAIESGSDTASTTTSCPSISLSPTWATPRSLPRRATVDVDDCDFDSMGSRTSSTHSSSRQTTPSSAGTPRSSESTGTGVPSPSTVEGFQRHRRSWSSQAPKSIIETSDAKSSEDPANGIRTLNQYRLGDELGKGSFGCVWTATDSLDGVDYAVKEFSKSRLRRQAQSASMRSARRRNRAVKLSPRMEKDYDGLRLIEHEVAIMKKLKHVNIISLREVLDDRENDSIFMILELCRGGPVMAIRTMEETDPLPEDVARSYFRQVLLALEYLHSLEICHHDIKPDNILLKSRGAAGGDLIKLVDFGVSQLFAKDDEPQSGKTAGSPAFQSPELNMSHPNHITPSYQRAADVWALGVTTYAFLTGRLPFRASNTLEMADVIANEPAAIPRSLSTEARDVLDRMLDKNPDTRIGVADLRDHPWTTEQGMSPLPSTAENCSPIEEPTTDDVANALRSLSGAASAIRAAQKLRRMAVARRSTSHQHDRVGSSPSASSSSTSPPRVDQRGAQRSSVSHADDSAVEQLRWLEETTGEMFQRSETIVGARSSGPSSSTRSD